MILFGYFYYVFLSLLFSKMLSIIFVKFYLPIYLPVSEEKVIILFYKLLLMDIIA